VNARVRQREATRASILHAALDAFAADGFEGASTRQIAAKAGVHHGLIKYHFTSKDLLWREAVTYLFERQAQEVVLPSPEEARFADPRDYARHVLRTRALYWSRHPQHARLMVQESCTDSERLRWLVEEHGRQTARVGEQFVAFLKEHGLVPREAPTVSLVYIIMGASQLFFTLAPEVQHTWGVNPADPQAIDDHIDALLSVLIR
jgi:TetR/AcrR family transcriptional regulator